MTDQCATCYGLIPMVSTASSIIPSNSLASRKESANTEANEDLWGCRYLRLGSFPSRSRLPFWSGHHQDFRA